MDVVSNMESNCESLAEISTEVIAIRLAELIGSSEISVKQKSLPTMQLETPALS